MAPYVASSVPRQVSVSNPHRVSITLFNPSTVDVYVGKGTDIKADGTGNSVPLKANGGSVIEGPPRTYTGDIYVISSGADTTIFVFENNDAETREN